MSRTPAQLHALAAEMVRSVAQNDSLDAARPFELSEPWTGDELIALLGAVVGAAAAIARAAPEAARAVLDDFQISGLEFDTPPDTPDGPPPT
ncbi:MAG: hypothetical protein EPN43_10345 [Jatrophihabitans sp.]|nr:MAG: hypothetical protein EPN43_10345 [Jatrophihabitans sp.]